MQFRSQWHQKVGRATALSANCTTRAHGDVVNVCKHICVRMCACMCACVRACVCVLVYMSL